MLIGGTEALTPSAYLDRLSMEGNWTSIRRDPEPPKYDPKQDVAAAAAVAAEGQPTGCIDKLIDRVPGWMMRTLCCEDEVELSRPMGTERSRGGTAPERQSIADESLVPRP